jgi:hypothetical protein
LKGFLSVFLLVIKAFAPVVLLARGFPLSRCRADSGGIGLASGNAS